jgi:hypothetical protein
MNFALRTIFHTSKGSIICHKILRLCADDFIFPPNEGVLRIIIALKIHRFRLGLIPRTLGPVTSTLTTRPPSTTEGKQTDIYETYNHYVPNYQETCILYDTVLLIQYCLAGRLLSARKQPFKF